MYRYTREYYCQEENISSFKLFSPVVSSFIFRRAFKKFPRANNLAVKYTRLCLSPLKHPSYLREMARPENDLLSLQPETLSNLTLFHCREPAESGKKLFLPAHAAERRRPLLFTKKKNSLEITFRPQSDLQQGEEEGVGECSRNRFTRKPLPSTKPGASPLLSTQKIYNAYSVSPGEILFRSPSTCNL